MATTDLTKYAENEEQLALTQLLSSPATIRKFEMAVGREAGSVMINIFNAATQNPEIWKCEPRSVINAALDAAVTGLSLSPSLGQACILPFNKSIKEGNTWRTEKRAQFVPMARGIKKMAMNTNKYRVLNAFEVYEGQVWVEDQMTGLGHIEGTITKKVAIGYGAYLELFDGYRATLYMTFDEVMEHAKKYSPTYDKSKNAFNPKSRWITDFDDQAEKTVLKRIILHKGVISEKDRSTLEQITDETKDAGPEWPENTQADELPGEIHEEQKAVEEIKISLEEAAYLSAKEVKTLKGSLVDKLPDEDFNLLLTDKFKDTEIGKAAHAIDVYRQIKAAKEEAAIKELMGG